jgi:hypothetical protein
MADTLAPAPSEPRLRGNSAQYLRSRLERDGYTELLAAIDRGELSIYGAACEVGYTKRPEPLGTGSPNARKRRDWAIHRAYRESARVDAALVPETPHNGCSAPAPTTPDLAAAIAEWEEARKPAPPRETLKSREPAPAMLPEPEHTLFPSHPAIPCTRCQRPEAGAALREVLDAYVAMRRGEPPQTGNVLPGACCQRQLLRRPDIRAMIA